MYDSDARIQLARERADELARDYRRAQKADARKRQSERATLAPLLNRLRRRPERAAAQRP
jgi:hypothetical protein